LNLRLFSRCTFGFALTIAVACARSIGPQRPAVARPHVPLAAPSHVPLAEKVPLGPTGLALRAVTEPYEEECKSAACQVQCAFASQQDGTVEYDGDLTLHGRAFASGTYFEGGDLEVRGQSLEALATMHASRKTAEYMINGFVDLTKLRFFARYPIVLDGWIHLYATMISGKDSFRGGSIRPKIEVPPYLKPTVSLSTKSFRVPCSMFSISNHSENSHSIQNNKLPLNDGQAISLAKSPGGAVLASINRRDTVLVEVLQTYLAQSFVALGDEHAQFLGWVESKHLPEAGGSETTLGGMGRISQTNGILCKDIDVLVVSQGATWRVMRVTGEDSFYGAFSKAGDYFVNLGQSPSSEDNAIAGKAPLDPFIPKEQMAHCTKLPKPIAH
jgi:hypothetical protein